MNIKKQLALNRFNAIDRMINEGLGSGSINPSYTQARLKLKENRKRSYLLLCGFHPLKKEMMINECSAINFATVI